MNKFHPVTLSPQLIKSHEFNYLGQRAWIIYIHIRSWKVDGSLKVTCSFKELYETTGIQSTRFMQDAITTLKLAGFIRIEELTDDYCSCHLVEKWL